MDKDDIPFIYGELARMRDLCWSLEVRVKKEKHFDDIIKTIVGCLDRFEIDFERKEFPEFWNDILNNKQE